ncbi:glycosyltransferase [Jannaschia pohangensis]|uniref:Putative rhamnosyl transferase n=1 Tax=Jannaschia pohangensis TaxID=390807 RepID=A0A1I3UYA3_9RHOB|nr:glycosyltransferase [Jannaschia pohangensis]SFJ88364.1 Putative rhamnosyl transferase [Jannaschia pohangensis]
MSDLQILAITRFAYPGLGMFQTEHDTVEARQAHLWSEARMTARFRTLEHVCLRTLAAQVDGDFRTIILTGDALPEPWRSRLVSLASGLPGAEVVFHPPDGQKAALSNVIRPRIDPDGPPVMYFRQDDDDGVARRFVGRCREIFGQMRPLWDRHKRLCIDFNKGVRLQLTPDGPRVEELFENHIGVGQAIFLSPDNKRTGMHFPHHRMTQLMPSLSIPDALMWVRGMDETNDSGVSGQLHRLKPADPDQCTMLKRRFALDLPAIRASF